MNHVIVQIDLVTTDPSVLASIMDAALESDTSIPGPSHGPHENDRRMEDVFDREELADLLVKLMARNDNFELHFHDSDWSSRKVKELVARLRDLDLPFIAIHEDDELIVERRWAVGMSKELRVIRQGEGLGMAMIDVEVLAEANDEVRKAFVADWQKVKDLSPRLVVPKDLLEQLAESAEPSI